MKTKVYENYIEEYKKDEEIDYFYAKDNLLNKLYGFEDRGEFTIEVLDEMLELQQKIDKATKYIKENCSNYYVNEPHYRGVELINIEELLEILGDKDV